MKDGAEKTIVAGESYAIPTEHDAWVEGKQPFVGIEVISADVYAKPAQLYHVLRGETSFANRTLL